MKNNEGQKTPTRVLPGFLRRSLRLNYSDDQDEDESSSGHEDVSPAEPPLLPRKEPPLEESKSETSTADETVASTSADLKTEPPQLENPPKGELERTVSYKDSMFEKAIGADVVNMSDLRRLGWNGIPVRG
jgi:hypothetical protein